MVTARGYRQQLCRGGGLFFERVGSRLVPGRARGSKGGGQEVLRHGREGSGPHGLVATKRRLEMVDGHLVSSEEKRQCSELHGGGTQESGLTGTAVVVGIGLDEVVQRGRPVSVPEIQRCLGQAHHEEPPVEVPVAADHIARRQARQEPLGVAALADLTRHPGHEGRHSRRLPADGADFQEEAEVLHATLEPPPR